jgi:hypothetical protein
MANRIPFQPPLSTSNHSREPAKTDQLDPQLDKVDTRYTTQSTGSKVDGRNSRPDRTSRHLAIPTVTSRIQAIAIN